jgi:penicillin-binding protein 1A
LEIVKTIFKNYKGYIGNQNGSYPEASCVIINPYNSDVLALVGGVGTKTQNRILNRATDTKRPIGSTIKPLSVYTPAIEWGDINYSTVLDDVPLTIDENSAWPKNSPDVYHGLVDIEYAVSHSVNTVAVKVLYTIVVR